MDNDLESQYEDKNGNPFDFDDFEDESDIEDDEDEYDEEDI